MCRAGRMNIHLPVMTLSVSILVFFSPISGNRSVVTGREESPNTYGFRAT